MAAFLLLVSISIATLVQTASSAGKYFTNNSWQNYFRLQLEPVQGWSGRTWVSWNNWGLPGVQQQRCDTQRRPGSCHLWLQCKYNYHNFIIQYSKLEQKVIHKSHKSKRGSKVTWLGKGIPRCKTHYFVSLLLSPVWGRMPILQQGGRKQLLWVCFPSWERGKIERRSYS